MLVKDVFGLGMYIFRRNSPCKSVHFWYVQIGEEVEKIIQPYKKMENKVWSKEFLKGFTKEVAAKAYLFWKSTGLKKAREKDATGKCTKRIIWTKA